MNATVKKDTVRPLIYTSADLATQHVHAAEKIQSEPGLAWGVPSMDMRGRVLPMRGGDVTLLVGRPGHGKSSLLCYHAQREAKAILARGAQDRETVVYVTWEGTVDAIYAAILAGKGGYSSTQFYWGDVPLQTVQDTAIHHGIMPVMMIGFSTLRSIGRDVPNMTLDVIFEAIQLIADEYGRRPTLILLDYLQLIPAGNEAERQDQVARAIINSKNLAMRMDVPFMLGAQASRDVDAYKVKLPEMKDVQWASQAEQHADKLFSLWMPARTEPRDRMGRPMAVEVDGRMYPGSDNLILVRLLKQRGECGRWTWALHLKPELLELGEMEARSTE